MKDWVVSVDMNTSVIEREIPEFYLYPNPCSDMITIRQSALGTRHSALTMSDLTGKVVFEKKIGRWGEGEISINVSHLPAGLYLVKL